MTHLDVVHDSSVGTPPEAHRRSRAFLIALLVHAAVIIPFLFARHAHLVRLAPQQQGIGAFISPGTAIGTTGTSQPVPKKTPSQEKVRREPKPAAAAAGSSPAVGAAAGQDGGGGAMGPVRLGAGQGLALLKRVEPVYPPAMQGARIEGQVVLDAVIHRDGTVGDVTVLKSTTPLFERAAIDAVKQWRYQPIPYEGLLTLTVNFNLR
jgi:protein TonB